MRNTGQVKNKKRWGGGVAEDTSHANKRLIKNSQVVVAYAFNAKTQGKEPCASL